jgi:ABC-type spermidine/putrescine transport system permease subunit II
MDFYREDFQMIQIQQSWLNSLLIAVGATFAVTKVTLMKAVASPAAIALVVTG